MLLDEFAGLFQIKPGQDDTLCAGVECYVDDDGEALMRVLDRETIRDVESFGLKLT